MLAASLYRHYELDEIANGKDTVMFCDGDKLVLTITIREGYFDFLFILGENDRRALEGMRGVLPQKVFEIYDGLKTWNEGKWIEIPVSDFEILEAVKQITLMKKAPNRVPFPKDTAVYSKCGMRCDLCVHYTGGTISGEFLLELKQRIGSLFGYEDYGDNMMRCPGCFNKDSEGCGKLDHAKSKGLENGLACEDCPCSDCGVLNIHIQATRSTPAKTITWAILLYVGGLTEGLKDKLIIGKTLLIRILFLPSSFRDMAPQQADGCKRIKTGLLCVF